jgi:hypothetical protein
VGHCTQLPSICMSTTCILNPVLYFS